MTVAVERERQFLQRERFFSARDVADILALLRSESATGTLSIDLSCGTANTIRFHERKQVSFDDTPEIKS